MPKYNLLIIIRTFFIYTQIFPEKGRNNSFWKNSSTGIENNRLFQAFLL